MTQSLCSHVVTGLEMYASQNVSYCMLHVVQMSWLEQSSSEGPVQHLQLQNSRYLHITSELKAVSIEAEAKLFLYSLFQNSYRDTAARHINLLFPLPCLQGHGHLIEQRARCMVDNYADRAEQGSPSPVHTRLRLQGKPPRLERRQGTHSLSQNCQQPLARNPAAKVSDNLYASAYFAAIHSAAKELNAAAYGNC